MEGFKSSRNFLVLRVDTSREAWDWEECGTLLLGSGPGVATSHRPSSFVHQCKSPDRASASLFRTTPLPLPAIAWAIEEYEIYGGREFVPQQK
jgi:hypothetical protein